MSTPTKTRGKRALPNIPLNRAASVDRIVTTTPKSTISKRTNFDSACVDVKKNRNCTSQQQQKNGPIMNSKTSKVPSELCSRGKDLSSSDSGSNTSSPFNSPRATRKGTVGPVVANIIDKFSTGSQKTTAMEGNDVKEEAGTTEKKIARVLPMTPQFIEEHLITNTEDEPSFTKHKEEHSWKINKLQSALGLNNNDGLKGLLTPKNSEINAPGVLQAKMAGTSISTTPQQPSSGDDGEGSSVRVGVRVRPFLPR